MGNARGVSRVTAAATHDWLGYDMAPCKFYEGRAAVTTSSSETKRTTSAVHHDTCTHRHAYARDRRHRP